MKLNETLKRHMREHFGTPVDATDEAITKSVSDNLASGKLDADTFASLVQEKAPDAKSTIEAIVANAMAPVMAQLKAMADANVTTVPITEKKADDKKPDDGKFDVAAEIEKAVASQVAKIGGGDRKAVGAGRAARLYGHVDANVKNAISRYAQTRKSLVYPEDSRHVEQRGMPVLFEGRAIEGPSNADKALAGAYLKFACGLRMDEHEEEVFLYALHELPWTGLVDREKIEVDNRKMTEFERKAVLDDATSGGTYAAPQILEDMIVMTPLLYGELYPLVSIMTVTSGRQFRNLTMGRPTATWSGNSIEGTALDLFDTTAFIGTLDTNVFDCTFGIELGLNWMEDSQIVGMADKVIAGIGEKAQEQLDYVIALGDGTTQPQGVFNAASTILVPSTNAGVGPVVLSDAEGLMFGVNKAHQRDGRNIFLSNETNWRRFSTLPVAAGWNQRMFDPNSYILYGKPWKCQNDLTNAQAGFLNARHYQMIRRLGIQFKRSTEGKELIRKNLELIVARMRYGGRLLLGGAFAKMTTLPLS